jgi:ADP-heptose:LPS heptosyltransferase
MDLDHGIFGTVTFKGLHYGVTTAASYGHTHIKSLADIAASLFVRVMARPADSREVLDAARRSGAIKSILWVRTDGLGDVAMALPALHMLRENFPDAHITAVVRPISAPLMRMIKDVNQTVEFEPSVAPAATRMRSTDSFVTLARKLRATRFDLAVTMPIGVAGIVQSQMVALASGAPYLMDPSSGMPAGAGAVHAMKMHCPEVTKHASIETLFKCLEHAGLSRPAAEYRLDVPQSDREKMRAKLDSFGMPQKFAIVHARSAEREREWQAERFSAVADHLIATHGLHVAATGTRRDKEVVERIVAGCRYPGKLVSLCGKISVEELPALYSQATLMVSVDTGPMHVASMVGTPIVALFLPYYRYNSPYLQANHVVGPTVDDIVSYVASGQLPASGALLDYVTVADVTNMIDNVMAESAEPA